MSLSAHLIPLLIILTAQQVLSFLQPHRESICFRASSFPFTRSRSNLGTSTFSMSPTTSTSSKAGLNAKPPIEVITQPDEAFLEKKGVFSWDTWSCGVSKFPWSYSETESCYLLAGKVIVTPSDGRPAVTISKGDYATFPAGMSCTWEVTEPVNKHYCFF